jgi:GR25 family glycosyltransferase involved in LPS biosynthesis
MNLIAESHIRFVNLTHRTDRLNLMLEACDTAQIPAVRVRGMLPSEYKGNPKRVEVMQKRTPGAIGCWFSQVKIMQEALRLRKHAWVMEDDLIFCKDFHARLARMEQFLTCRIRIWDILWLGATFHVNPPYWHKQDLGRDAETTDDPRMLRTFGAFCTYAYIVRDRSIERVLHLLDEWLDLSMGIDWAMIQIQPQLQTFAFVPGSVIQRDNKSDIGSGMTIFSGFSKLGPYWFAERMEDFDPTTFEWHEANLNNRK